MRGVGIRGLASTQVSQWAGAEPIAVPSRRPSWYSVALDTSKNPRVGIFSLLATANWSRLSAYANPHTAGKVTVTRKTSTSGSAADTIQHGNIVDNVSANAANEWWKVDLDGGVGRRATLTHLSFRQRTYATYIGYNHMQACTIEGSLNDTDWTTLATVTDGGMNEGNTAWTDIALTAMSARYIRLTMNGTDTMGQNYLCIGQIELFGGIFGTP